MPDLAGLRLRIAPQRPIPGKHGRILSILTGRDVNSLGFGTEKNKKSNAYLTPKRSDIDSQKERVCLLRREKPLWHQINA
jgi:hypothetical protein